MLDDTSSSTLADESRAHARAEGHKRNLAWKQRREARQAKEAKEAAEAATLAETHCSNNRTVAERPARLVDASHACDAETASQSDKSRLCASRTTAGRLRYVFFLGWCLYYK